MGIVAIFCCLIILVPSSSAKKVIDGQWSSWGSYIDCSTSCGDGRKVRKRTCSNPPPSNGGKLCKGAERQFERCNLRGCFEAQTAKGGTCSYTDEYDTRKNTKQCKQWYSLCTSKKWKRWLSFACAKTCKCVIDGQWSSWGSYSDCSTSCGDGTKVLERTCSNPPPSNGGKLCQGAEIRVAKCDLPGCGGTTCSYTDKYDKYCKKWKKDCTSKTKKSKSWMSANCAKTCKCGGTTCSYTDKYDCKKWKKDCTSKTKKLKSWMSANCAETCKCGGTTCSYSDKYDAKNCKKWKKYCTSKTKKLKSWMSANCAKTCKCGTCPYKDSNCQTWKAEGKCTKTNSAAWMNWYCQATCKC